MNDAAVANAGFQFVQGLAADLNRGDIKIPSFPDVVMRIKRALEEQDCNSDKLARIVATDQALAARLLKVANSALMQRGSSQVQDLKTAISRLGHDMLHNAAISVAVEQIFIGASLGDQRERLRGIWRDAAHVAAVSFTLARRLTKINPDEALLAGLLHNVGKLYVVMNADRHAEFFAAEDTLELVVTYWHGEIGKAILESWGFSDSNANAAADHLDLDRQVLGPPDLTDIVTAAWLMSRKDGEPVDLDKVRACTRLRLTAETREAIMRESADDINALAKALNG